MAEGSVHRPLLLAGLVLAVALVGPLVAPFDPNHQLDPAAGRLLPPGSVRQVVRFADGHTLLAERVERSDNDLLVVRQGRVDAVKAVDLAADRPVEARRFLLGTDRFGRDLLSRLLVGARTSLSIGLAAALLAFVVGLLVGGIAGWCGGWTDEILMRLADGLLAFPRLLLLLLLAAWRSDAIPLALLIGSFSWMEPSRMMRGEIRSLKQRDMTLAARATGLSSPRIFFRHLLPLALPPLLVDATLRVGDAILLESSLSFLGLGIQPPTPTWGNMVADAQSALLDGWWLAAFPGAAIVVTVFACNWLGDVARDRLAGEG